ncbi:helix-turn-helix transcriptional regulator [Sphaerisporangium sp. NBC_01403]|uniref:helix-turn-helix transcriptional regulator n=1 Tax=Sphaerisporangium sp. NBC_01403 TaxID=2903599 RepID=UPI0032556072
MDAAERLGGFLRSRRTRLHPQELGVTTYGGRRRVKGLRREELAQLAGVSVDYYARLEQGRSRNASPLVLDALARALQLDESERAHLFDLAALIPDQDRGCPLPPPLVRPATYQLLEALDKVDMPAAVVGLREDILASNVLYRAFVKDFAAAPAPERNMARFMFFDPFSRELYLDWEGSAGLTAAFLRFDFGRYPDDRQLRQLLNELAVGSEDFRRIWAEQPVLSRTHSGSKDYRHELVGMFTVTYQLMALPDVPDQNIVIYTAQPHSPSAEAMRSLAKFARDNIDPRSKPR